MTDEMLDYLEGLADAVVLRDGDAQIAVLPVLVAEIKRLRAILAALREPSIAMVQVIDDYIFRGAMTSDEDVQEAVRAVLAEAEREASA